MPLVRTGNASSRSIHGDTQPTEGEVEAARRNLLEGAEEAGSDAQVAASNGNDGYVTVATTTDE
jgi:hypothetical protein